MDLISIIIIIAIIKKVLEKAGEASKKVERYGKSQNVWDQVVGTEQSRQYTNSKRGTYSANSNEQWKQTARVEIEKVRKKAVKTLREVENVLEIEDKPTGTYQMPKRNERTTPAYEQINMQSYQEQQAVREKMERTKQRILESHGMVGRTNAYLQQENKSAMQQVQAGRMEARNTSILERAKSNADEDKVDVTLETMEREHNHSERVSPAEHYHPEENMPENMLGKIEDLMIKGYDGNLCFERDFIGEAMDMISHFTISTEIPNPSVDDIA